MTTTNKGLISLCIPLLIIFSIFTGCEDPGSVGSNYVDRPTLTFDTLTINQTEILSYTGYSGRLGMLSMGQYSDALFGDLETKTYVRPTLRPPIPDSVSLAEDFDMKLKISLDSLEVYGDTLSQSSFGVYEITSPWRGTALRFDDVISYSGLVGNFTIGNEDEIFVDLDQSWIDKFKSYYYSEDANADSLYNDEFLGLALVSDQQNNKISFANTANSRFVLINGASSDTTDTVNVTFKDYGYTLDRTNEQNPNNTFTLHTTLEGMFGITMPDSILRVDNNEKNIIRTEIVLYEATDIMEANLPANHYRRPVSTINLDLKEVIEPAYEYQFGATDYVGSTNNESPRAFQINISPYMNNVIFGNETRKELILGIGSTFGYLRSTLIYDHTAAPDLRPKIIITSLVD